MLYIFIFTKLLNIIIYIIISIFPYYYYYLFIRFLHPNENLHFKKKLKTQHILIIL